LHYKISATCKGHLKVKNTQLKINRVQINTGWPSSVAKHPRGTEREETEEEEEGIIGQNLKPTSCFWTLRRCTARIHSCHPLTIRMKCRRSACPGIDRSVRYTLVLTEGLEVLGRIITGDNALGTFKRSITCFLDTCELNALRRANIGPQLNLCPLWGGWERKYSAW